MKTSKMLPMEPVAAAALTRALSRQFIQAFITLDLQHGSPLSDSAHGMRCSWRSRRPEAVRCTDFKLIELLIVVGC